MIDIKHIRHIVALYEVGTVTGAAERLHMSQPTLTSHLCRLEDRLGEPLFIRSARGLEPTLLGESMYRRGRQMLRQWVHFENEIDLLAGAELGELRVACGAVIEQKILPDALVPFLQEHPLVNIQVEVISPAKMLEHLEAGEADIAVGAFGDELSADIKRITVGSQPVGFYVRHGHPYLATAAENAQFQSFPLALPTIPDNMHAWFKAKGFDVTQQRLKSENYDLMKQVALTSDLVVGGPPFIFAKELADGRMHPLPIENCPQWSPSILVAPAARLSKVARGLVEALRHELLVRLNS